MTVLGIDIPENQLLDYPVESLRGYLSDQLATFGSWTDTHISHWRQQLLIRRDYESEVVNKIQSNDVVNNYDLVQYGALAHDAERYPLFYLKSRKWDNSNPAVLVIAGVHGYEPSGILAALRIASTSSLGYVGRINMVVFPCISPWGYEMDHRWNYYAQDPNRGYVNQSEIEECSMFMQAINRLGVKFDASIDLHETPNRDVALRILRASRFGTPLSKNFLDIPQGFYLVVDKSYKGKADAHRHSKSIINKVAKECVISQDALVMDESNYNGVVYMDIPGLGATWLQQSNFSSYSATTEVYSTSIGEEKSTEAQLAAVNGLCAALLEPKGNM